MPTSTTENTPSTAQLKQRSPFYLEGTIDLTLHTRLAQSLLDGSWMHGHLGLWQFAMKVRDLWKAHRADDPYADWYFMKIDEKIHALREEIQTVENYCDKRLSQLRGFTIQVFENPHPLQLALKFGIPFSYMGASLLPDLDYISRQAYTLRHVGQLLEPGQLPLKIAFGIRQLFSLPIGWKMHVTRQDICENNAIAQAAQEKMGAIPTAILNKEMKFLFLLDTMLGDTKTVSEETKDSVKN
jgi:integrating conjugative element protein (TIGR03761 family)